MTDQDQNEPGGEGGELLDGGDAHGPVDDQPTALRQRELVGQQTQMEPVLVHTHIEIGDDILDDLAEGQRHNGQIVAVEPQHRDPDQHAGDGGEHRANGHADHQPQRAGDHDALQGHGGGHAGEGAHAHEARVTQTQLAGDSHHQIQRQGHHHIGADGHQHPLQGGFHGAAGGHALENDKGGDHNGIGDEIAS